MITPSSKPAKIHLTESKELEKRTLTQLEIQERIQGRGSSTRERSVWFCCKNGRTDSKLLQFIVSTTFSFIILMFSIFQLIRLDDPQAQNTYISLLTLVFGIFIPTPRVKI
tara:strand:+ start:471 stop:803 length:333 start_codon:yes stop_codon:yes gene_type:complete